MLSGKLAYCFIVYSSANRRLASGKAHATLSMLYLKLPLTYQVIYVRTRDRSACAGYSFPLARIP